MRREIFIYLSALSVVGVLSVHAHATSAERIRLPEPIQLTECPFQPHKDDTPRDPTIKMYDLIRSDDCTKPYTAVGRVIWDTYLELAYTIRGQKVTVTKRPAPKSVLIAGAKMKQCAYSKDSEDGKSQTVIVWNFPQKKKGNEVECPAEPPPDRLARKFVLPEGFRHDQKLIKVSLSPNKLLPLVAFEQLSGVGRENAEWLIDTGLGRSLDHPAERVVYRF